MIEVNNIEATSKPIEIELNTNTNQAKTFKEQASDLGSIKDNE